MSNILSVPFLRAANANFDSMYLADSHSIGRFFILFLRRKDSPLSFDILELCPDFLVPAHGPSGVSI